ncbi:putative Kinase [Melia azedarach]|uniref:Kinase n=1 Tax=Melia azedarach TaxID=155640 RepID=A0ACC1X939_MELAZ|nr:putative Kinase [Melia azedarach]
MEKIAPSMFMSKFFTIWFSLLLFRFVSINGQQTYVNNCQLDCYDQTCDEFIRGFACNGVSSSCQSYITFRSNPPYNSPISISYLLKSSVYLIASTNNITSFTTTIPTGDMVIIPINCSCSGQYYQYNATHVIDDKENYFTVANDTYQGLSTCQAMMNQNPYDSRRLFAGLNLVVPIRCACPTLNQTASGFRYLLTYMITWGDTISAIAELFNVDTRSVLHANNLLEDDLIYPFTPILVPLKTPPTKIGPIAAYPPPPSPPRIQFTPPTKSTSHKKWVFVGVGIGAGFLLLVSVLAFLFCFCRRRSKKQTSVSSSGPKKISENYSMSPDNSKSFPTITSSQGFRNAVDSLTVYKFQDLQIATGNFSEENRIKESVYKGSFKGDDAAVKVMKGDVSSEINILKKINHSNIVRLSGFCVHEGNTYLVYEYAENGALSDWLHLNKYQNSDKLTWKQRVHIAYDVANALNYLHKYSNPPYIHKNLKTSNILLDTNMRAKIANFGLARSVDNDGQHQGGLQLTRHVVGTYGYMAPEYIENGVVTPKLDVFAFGIVILEILSGREAATGDKNSGEELLSTSVSRVLEENDVKEKLRRFIDPSLGNEYPLDLAFSMAQLAKNCLAQDLNARPSMSQVLITLSKILSALSYWDPFDEVEIN